ncbi:ribokinase [Cecembia calidifontis]|uniref:Ribokinase n=2 Tax=Cecembia calidifontis TaxID=1187080 RepID=A0A4Q7P5I8_9BACT|nr:ribokinase [Cecembia calidifontis]
MIGMTQKPKILVIGSANMDMVIQSDHFPVPGETIIGGDFSLIPGGKGANQAVAAARLGGDVCFITRLGEDIFGSQNLLNFQKEGIDTSYIHQIPEVPSGVALITVDKSGENTIIVAPGANAHLTVGDMKASEQRFEETELILLQLEIPLETVVAAAALGNKLGKKVLLNPAPAQKLPDKLYRYLQLITPNETEAEFLTGIAIDGEASAEKAAKFFIERGVQDVIITLGSKGAYLHSSNFKGILPTSKVTAKDTTAAGDTFNGALAVALGKGLPIKDAVNFAMKAATLSVQRMGAQTSIPYIHELSIP